MHFEFIHFYVEDARYWRDWFIQALGFQPLTKSLVPVPEAWTANSAPAKATQTFGVRSGTIQIFLSSACNSTSPVFKYLKMHPPGVVDLAFRVTGLEAAVSRAVAYGAKLLHSPQISKVEGHVIKTATIAGWGSLHHTLVEYLTRKPDQVRTDLEGDTRAELEQDSGVAIPVEQPFERAGTADGATGVQSLQPGLNQTGDRPSSHSHPLPHPQIVAARNGTPMVSAIDHAVINVPQGQLQEAVTWYTNVFGFEPQQSFQIQTQRSALRSQVLSHPSGTVQVPINEPASPMSQIQEFLDFNRGAGIQHIALSTPDIVATVAHLRQKGVRFLAVPPTYYEQLQERPAFRASAVNWRAIADQEILVDWADEHPQAMLLQTFTQPLFGQPTFFFEIIQRQKFWAQRKYEMAKGFGEGNFQALFEAIEREQIKRGSLR